MEKSSYLSDDLRSENCLFSRMDLGRLLLCRSLRLYVRPMEDCQLKVTELNNVIMYESASNVKGFVTVSECLLCVDN